MNHHAFLLALKSCDVKHVKHNVIGSCHEDSLLEIQKIDNNQNVSFNFIPWALTL